MATREDSRSASRRWEDLGLLQEHYKEFNTLLVDVIEGFMNFKCTDIQKDIGDYIAHGPQYRMVQAQRGQAKTTIAAVTAVWKFIHNPTTRVLIISAGDTQATEIANWVIQIINGMPELECLRPDRAAGDRCSVEAFDIHYSLKGPEKSPSLACIGITSNMQGKRADFLIADDIESQKNSQTATQRARVHLLTLDFTSICSNGEILYLGTPQSVDSIYNTLPGRGYSIRIWPGRYPTADELREYDGMVAPLILERLSARPELAKGGGPTGERGQPIDPVMLSEETLTKKEIDQGAAYFQLQHMLSTHLSDANRFPLKLSKVRFMSFDREERSAPMTILHVPSPDTMLNPPQGWPIKDRMYRVKDTGDYSTIPVYHMYVDPSGGGKNGDEMAFAVTGFLAGRIFVVACGGVPGGIEDEQVDYIIAKINKWKPVQLDIEENFGKGAFSHVLRAKLYSDHNNHKPGIEDVWESGQKELRIIDILEPVIGAGKLVVHEDMIEEDVRSIQRYPTDKKGTFSLFWQMSRITRDKGSLVHDDRLDALAGSVRHWVEFLAIDEEKSKAKARQDAYREMMKNPLGNGRPMPGWESMSNKYGKVPNALSKHGISTSNRRPLNGRF